MREANYDVVIVVVVVVVIVVMTSKGVSKARGTRKVPLRV